MSFASRAKIRWVSSSELEPAAILKNFVKSLLLSLLLP
jgi:hypothetical protein